VPHRVTQRGNRWQEVLFCEADYVSEVDEPEPGERLRRRENTGRPMGDRAFLERLNALLHRDLAAKKPGRKLKRAN